ncbi:hypothetical protein AB0I54_26585 [Streptomyces sp. NPDC050625]|uniref:hypothetical protein n=1 Tax=Streptomyces sp. NPDC050625 TaxID=3154629 RepID=UPI00341F00CB
MGSGSVGRGCSTWPVRSAGIRTVGAGAWMVVPYAARPTGVVRRTARAVLLRVFGALSVVAVGARHGGAGREPWVHMGAAAPAAYRHGPSPGAARGSAVLAAPIRTGGSPAYSEGHAPVPARTRPGVAQGAVARSRSP